MAGKDNVLAGLGLVPPFQEWGYGTSYHRIRLPTIQLRRIIPNKLFDLQMQPFYYTLH